MPHFFQDGDLAVDALKVRVVFDFLFFQDFNSDLYCIKSGFLPFRQWARECLA
jgi:hypothetical protein